MHVCLSPATTIAYDHSANTTLTQCYLLRPRISIVGCFGVAVTAFVTSTKLRYVKPG